MPKYYQCLDNEVWHVLPLSHMKAAALSNTVTGQLNVPEGER